MEYFIRWPELLFYHLTVEKYYFNDFVVIPKSPDWYATNPGIRDWRENGRDSASGGVAITSC